MRFTETNPVQRLSVENRFRLMGGLPLLPDEPQPSPIMKTGIEIVADLITDVLSMDGLHPDTRRLLEAAREAQITGKMPDLKELTTNPIVAQKQG